ncbi:Tetratricopeptide repeat protein [Caulifigura coniformis]|uniref:Tetratricopeptide repeat protein n=1 Tax=Caulifigura coniformis TaxID=2527983 RepID=A0A517S9K2_9PLAN|nr:tetratricopeptide repeat protein [Caulifigura coniformis]QDT52809.1 Tetratricopeptide repeat protein [Caulifigura coniformis]
MLGSGLVRAEAPPGLLDESAKRSARRLEAPNPLEKDLEVRVGKSPKDGAAWRMLGRLRMQRGDWEGAMEALERAVTLDQLSAAAFFDYGQAASHLGHHAAARAALQRVQSIAPESEYASQAESLIEELPAEDGGVQQASYELRTFDGSNLRPLIAPEITDEEPGWDDALDVRLDLNAQYNSNVTLAPSSRELSGRQRGSAQGMGSMSLRWAAIDSDVLRLGPSFETDFTLNERNLDQYDLQSYRPGLWAESLFDTGPVMVKPRVAYIFDYDEFGGKRFGERHSLAFSASALWTPVQTTTWYYSIDNNNIAEDGVDPSQTSQDGWSNTLGAVHDFVNRDLFWRSFRIGSDFQNVNTDGDIYRFYASSIYSQSIIVLTPGLNLKLRGGYAYRNYPDFPESPSRNTHVLRAGAELRKYFDDGLSAALYSNYDRFASRNDHFDSERFINGAMMSWEY